jgi:hypothetical protein
MSNHQDTKTPSGTDYMGTQTERAKWPHVEEVFREISRWRAEPKEQDQVFRALWAFWNFAHVWDDLIDLDRPDGMDGAQWKLETKERMHRALAEFVSNLLMNPFLFTNAESVEAMLVSAVGRQLDGDLLKERGESEDLQRAVRCGDVDLVLHLARLAGGWPCMRAVAPMCRFYDKGERPAANEAVNRIVALSEWVEHEEKRQRGRTSASQAAVQDGGTSASQSRGFLPEHELSGWLAVDNRKVCNV